MKCIGCYDRPPAPNSKFCTQKCAYLWAENMNESQAWCPKCKEWNEPWSLTADWYACIEGHEVRFR